MKLNVMCSAGKCMIVKLFQLIPNYSLVQIYYLIIFADTYFAVTNNTSQGYGDKCLKCDISK